MDDQCVCKTSHLWQHGIIYVPYVPRNGPPLVGLDGRKSLLPGGAQAPEALLALLRLLFSLPHWIQVSPVGPERSSQGPVSNCLR